MEAMMDAIEAILPIGGVEWEQVAETHSTSYPNHNREAQSLRRKFRALYNERIPTGDPECPPHVRQAKRARYAIEERADSSNLAEGSGVDLGFDDINEDEGVEEEVSANEGRVLFAAEGNQHRELQGRLFLGHRAVQEAVAEFLT
jgi:hypothetical protein